MAKPTTPLLAADCAVFDTKGRVLLIRRGNAWAGDDAAAAEWVNDWSRLELAFDHAAILADAVRMLRPRPAGGRPAGTQRAGKRR